MGTPASIRISAGSAGTGAASAAVGKPQAEQADAFMALLAAGGEEAVAGTGLVEEKPARDAPADEESDPLALLFPNLLNLLPAEADQQAGEEGLDAGLSGGSGNAEGADALLRLLDSADGQADAAAPDAQLDAALDTAMADPDVASPGESPGSQDLRQLLQSMTLGTREGAEQARAPAPIATDAPGATPSSSLSPLAQQSHAAAPAGAVEHAVRTAVGTPRWADEVGSRLLLMTARGQQEGSLTLTPEDLGPLEVRISMTQNTANVWFGAQQADTRAALAEAIPRLREMFAEAGLSLGHAGVSHEAPRQQSADVPRRGFASAGEHTSAPATQVRANARVITSALLDVYA